MTPETAYTFLLPATLKLFPDSEKFRDSRACAMLLAIGMMESDFKARRQRLNYSRPWWEFGKSPAVSYWMFENIGIAEVLRHHASRDYALRVLRVLGLPEHIPTIREALVYNDILAASWARLALWRHPYQLPEANDMEGALNQYLDIWRPGRFKAERWEPRYKKAWRIVGIYKTPFKHHLNPL